MDYSSMLSNWQLDIIRVNRDRSLGLSDSTDSMERAAFEAACCLVYTWGYSFDGTPDIDTLERDVDQIIAHLNRWKFNLAGYIHNLE